MADLEQHGDKGNANELTWREQEVLNLLGERLTNREIAEQLYITENTVKDYVSKILSKLYVRNRREAVERALKLGLLGKESAGETPDLIHSQLPPERTPFVGRINELNHIKEELEDTRLLTLVGPGGIGKTRLVIKVAQEASKKFKDGVFFIGLAPLRASKDISQTIAEGLKFPLATDEEPRQQLIRFLRDKQVLLILDNFEHLLDGVDIVTDLLEVNSEVKILVTSRERLNLQPETVHIVSGMVLPEGQSEEEIREFDAVQLFIQSAGKVRPGYDPTATELKEIVQICQIVGGMPLAIELAAAWLYILGVDEISAELGKDLDILTTEARDTPHRHRSIRAVFDQSWSLLDRSEQEIINRASVFRGGFTKAAVEQVAGASIRQLAGLANKSFINHDPVSGRYEIHELLRQHAQDQLEKTPEMFNSVQEAHAAYYAEFMEKGWERIKSPEQMNALDEIEADIENIRAAWRFSLENKDASKIWQFIYCLWHFHYIRWWNLAGLELFSEAVNALEGSEGTDMLALISLSKVFQGYFMTWMGLHDQAYDNVFQVVETLEELDYPQALAFAYESLGMATYFLHRYEEQIEIMNKMVVVSEEIGDKWLLGYAYWCRGISALVEEDYEGAKRYAQINLELYEEVGDVSGVSLPLIVLGHVSIGTGELEKARDYYRRSLISGEETNFYYAIQTVSKYLCRVCITLGDYDEAEENLRKSLKIAKEIRYVRDQVNLLFEYARLQAAYGNLEEAVQTLAMVIEHPFSDLYRMLEGRIRDNARNLLGEIEGQLPQETYTTAYQSGQLMDLDSTIAEILG